MKTLQPEPPLLYLVDVTFKIIKATFLQSYKRGMTIVRVSYDLLMQEPAPWPWLALIVFILHVSSSWKDRCNMNKLQ